MKYRNDGRTYRLLFWFPFFRIGCGGCAFEGKPMSCPKREDALTAGVSCARGDGINRVWRETIPSKIINWIRSLG